MNLVVLIGRLTSDPKLSYTPSTQTAVASFRLAVPKRNRDETPNFIQCKVFGRQAEALDRYKARGDEVAVNGRIETGSYKNREGVMVYTTEVICDNVEFTHGSKDRHEDSEDTEPYKEERRVSTNDDWGDSWQQADDDIPF